MKALSAALIFLAFPATAFACRCFTGMTLDQQMQSHDVVFAGQVSEIRQSLSGEDVQVTFLVTSRIKGHLGNIAKVSIPGDPAACGYVRPFFQKHNIYVVFTDTTPSGLETSRCSPNKLGPPSSIAIEAMRNGT
jgi:hypothetical protein